MEVSFSHYQITGVPVENSSINQENVGGQSVGLVTRYYSESGWLVHTSSTFDSEEALIADLDPTLDKLLNGNCRRVPCGDGLRTRGII